MFWCEIFTKRLPRQVATTQLQWCSVVLWGISDCTLKVLILKCCETWVLTEDGSGKTWRGEFGLYLDKLQVRMYVKSKLVTSLTSSWKRLVSGYRKGFYYLTKSSISAGIVSIMTQPQSASGKKINCGHNCHKPKHTLKTNTGHG